MIKKIVIFFIILSICISYTSATQVLSEDAIIVDLNDGEATFVIDEIIYDLDSGHIFIIAPQLSCTKDSDRMFSDRFQKELKIQINDGESVVLERFEYFTGIGVVEIDTRDSLTCEEQI